MKQNHIKYLVLFLSLFFIFISCDSNKNYHYVATKTMIIDSVSKASQDKISALFDKIEALNPAKIFQKKLIELDSLNHLETILNTQLVLEDSYLNNGLNITPENSILIKNPSNLMLFYGDRDTTNQVNFIVSKLKRDPIKVNEIFEYDYIPEYFYFYKDGSFNAKSFDSIYNYEKEKLILNYQEKISKLDNIKYGITISDLLLVNPHLIDKDYFSAGIIISEIRIYNLTSKELVGIQNISVKNREEVSHLFTINLGDLTTQAINVRLKEDLLQQKFKKIITKLNIK